ncbi:MOB member 4, phocein [Xylographa soralifera]|nr:MOB member 4, phocein [Xylographa soralifera]
MASAVAPAGSLSPSTSPRLPSPPPFPEVQIGPKSPVVRNSGGNLVQNLNDHKPRDDGSSRRIRPGTKAADMPSGPPLVPLSEVGRPTSTCFLNYSYLYVNSDFKCPTQLDSPFQLQEHLKALYFHATKSEQSNTTIPINRETAYIIASPPENVDRFLWLYELCRLLVQKANNLIVGFFSDSPPCSAQNCPEMRASEWQYLCAVHDPPKSCCAIDYCCHTLDWAANVLTSPKHFPSRLTLGSDSTGGSSQGVRQLTNIFRRVYRMFAHAWFQHREVFWNVESHEGLYILYKTVCDVYNLIPEENYTVPPEAEGLGAEAEFGSREVSHALLERSSSVRQSNTTDVPEIQEDGEIATTTISTGATTRRHKHTPSTGSLVATIAEGDEESHEATQRNISHETPVLEEEPSIIEIEQSPPVALPLSMEKAASTDPEATRNEDETAMALEDGIKGLTIDHKMDVEPIEPHASSLESSDIEKSEVAVDKAEEASLDT